MQKTAVIVSGSLRHMSWAATSWQFKNADYFLVVDESIQAAQSQTFIDSAYNQLPCNNIKFTSTCILASNAAIDENLLEKFPAHSTNVSVKMAFKWLVAYNQILAFNKNRNYNRIVLIRPDLYLWGAAEWPDMLCNFNTLPNTVHSVAGISEDWNKDRNYPVMGDVLFVVDLETFEKLSGFYAYFLKNYNLIQQHRYDIHSLLPKFLTEHNIKVSGDLSPWLTFNVLRPNMEDCFDAHGLKQGLSPNVLINKQQEWWKNKYGT